MDAAVAWLQEEQMGPAKETWLNIWETNNEIHQLEQTMAVTNPNNNNSNNVNGSLDSTNNNSNNNNSNKTLLNDGGDATPPGSSAQSTADGHQTPSPPPPPVLSATTTPVVSANGPAPPPLPTINGGGGGGGGGQSNGGNPMLDRAYNPTRRKLPEKYENKASTFNMNKNRKKLIYKYNGCPWREPNVKYSPGIIG